MQKLFSGYGAALGATAIWAGNFVAARALAQHIPPIQFNFWRWFLAFLVLLPFALPHLRADWRIARNNLGYISIMAILGVTLMNTFVYKAGQSVESLNMALIMPATPALIMVLARFVYGEKLTLRGIAGIIAASIGIVVLISRGSWARLANLHFQPGDIWTLGCMLCFALYSLFMRQRPHEISALGFNVIVFGVGLLWCLPMVGLEIFHVGLPAPALNVVTGVVYSGIGCSAIAFWLWTIAIDHIGPVKSGFVYYLLPFFAALMAKIVLDENVVQAQIWGGFLIIGGILLATIKRQKA